MNTPDTVRYAALIISTALVGIYLLEHLIPAIVEYGALVATEFWQRPWTIITSIFLHSPSDYMHLLNNLFFLAIFGFMLENLIGTKRFLTLFFTAGIFANFAAFTFYTDSMVLGASGAISGIIATIAVIKPRATGLLYGIPAPMWLSLLGWIGSNLIQSPEILQLLGASISGADSGGTAFMAHLYGLAYGIGYGLYLRQNRSDETPENQEEDTDIDVQSWEDEYMRK